MRAIFQWNVGARVLELGRRTLIMGVVNVTPDSFSDGGLYIDAEKAVVRAEQLLDEGATIIDVGGESTRPGVSEPVSEGEERRRVLPVIRDLKRRRPDAVVSVDTYKASVARAAGGVAVAAADWRSGADGEAGFAPVGRDGDPGGDQTRSPGAGSGVRVRETLRGELSAAGALRRVAADGISAAGGSVAEVIYWTNAGARRQGCAGRRAPLRDAGCRIKFDIERGAHHSDARCAICGGGGTSGGCDRGERRIERVP